MPSLLNPGPSMSFFSSSLPLFFRNRKKCYDLNPPEENHQVTYLGNMVTIMGKSDACVDRPLEVITRAWGAAAAAAAATGGSRRRDKRQQTAAGGGSASSGVPPPNGAASFAMLGNSLTQQRQHLAMRLCVCRSGLRAETSMGVTEYFAHRITWSAAPSQYPRVFCWVYKHEGKRMRPELRCHAVLCRRADEPQLIHETLRQHLQSALQEYKREKMAAERTRHRRTNVLLMMCPSAFYSSATAAVATTATNAAPFCGNGSNTGDDAVDNNNPRRRHRHPLHHHHGIDCGGGSAIVVPPQQAMPRRKAVLQTGTLNFRPPLSRSRSVPRLCSIDEEEAREEEEDDDDDDIAEEEEELLLSDIDSLNTADHYQPMPTGDDAAATGSTTLSSGRSTSSRRSSACCNDDDDNEEGEEEGRDECGEGARAHAHHHNCRHYLHRDVDGHQHDQHYQQQHCANANNHTVANKRAVVEEDGDDCSADSGYSMRTPAD